MKKIFKQIIKPNFSKIILSIFFAIISISTLLLANNSKAQKELKISIEKINSNEPIIIEQYLIDNNNYKENDLFEINDKNELVYYNNDLSLNMNEDNSFILNISDENILNINATYQEEKLNIEHNNGIYSLSVNKNFFELIKSAYKNINVIYILMFIILIFINYLMIEYIFTFIKKLYSNKIKIIDIIIFATILFILFYLNFYMLLNLLKYGLIILILFIVGYIYYKNKKSEEFKLENNYLILFAFIGTMLIFLIPPFLIPDEDNHYIKSYVRIPYLEKDNSISDEDNTGRYVNISENMLDFRKKYSNYKLDYDNKYNSISYFEEYTRKNNYKEISNEKVYYGTILGNNLDYIPSSIVNFILKRLNVSPILMFLCSRFINYLIYLIMTFYALKIIPKYKYLLFIVLTFGISFYQGVGVNQDYLNNASLILMIAYIFNFLFTDKKIERIDYLKFILLFMLLAFSKTIYTIFILLIMLVDNEKFKSKIFKKDILNKIFLVLVAFLITIIAYKLPSIRSSYYNLSSTSLNEHYTLKYLISNPISTVIIYTKTIVSRFSLDVFRGFFDGYGWSTIWHYDLILYLLCFIYIVLLITQPYEKFKSSDDEKKFKILNVLLFCLIYILTSYSMLTGWTKFGDTYIDGLQPRYFIIPAFLLYTCLNTKYIKLNVKNSNMFVTYAVLFTTFISIVNMLSGFYY